MVSVKGSGGSLLVCVMSMMIGVSSIVVVLRLRKVVLMIVSRMMKS